MMHKAEKIGNKVADTAIHGLKVGQKVKCCVDLDRRLALAANHTMTHVLNYGLRQARE